MIAESLLPEFDQECATTRKHLARTVADRFEWVPPEKSMTARKTGVAPCRTAGVGEHDDRAR